MKVALVITNHHSQNLRPYGRELLINAMNSFKNNAKFKYEIVIVDNQSDTNLANDFESVDGIHYFYVKNQWERGLTGAWNLGIKEASKLDCDIILNSNDDVIFNESINDFVDKIAKNRSKDNAVFGPVTNGVEGVQYSEALNSLMSKELVFDLKVRGLLNGFFFGLTNSFYKKYMYENGDLFAEFNKFDKSYIHKWARADGKWGGQEGEFERWVPLGARFFVVGECWINHLDKSDWYRARCVAGEFGWHMTEGYQ